MSLPGPSRQAGQRATTERAGQRSVGTCGLLELSSVLQHVLLPLLGARDIAALAQVSRELKSLVYLAPVSVWEAAARAVLPGAHPLGHPVTRAGIQETLRAYTAACHSIESGTATKKQKTKKTKKIASCTAMGSW
ncbi:hypothetical protein WJX73_010087 [Symbiochloris irregularis]|uniref:F-box domain-containing protein n=1 Tax=Symbiochloris irregularis TaxID=706552 RepID=A0AAW1NSX7_9CHLO